MVTVPLLTTMSVLVDVVEKLGKVRASEVVLFAVQSTVLQVL